MMTEKQAYIVTSLDLHTVDLEDFQFGKTNMTALRLVHEENENFANLLEQINSRLNGYRRPAVKTLRTETVLMYDAVSLFANALSAMDGAKNMVAFSPVYCDQMNKGSDGTSLINFMKSTKLENGLTGNINFDAEGYRTHMELDVIHLTEEGLKKIGTIEPGRTVNVASSVSVKQEFKDLEHKLYVVTTYLNPPYMMLKESSKTLSGNEIFEGFGYDLLYALADILHFRFQIRVVEDRQYGAYNETTKKWTGMIGEIRQDVADMAIADLTINSYREAVVDFTMPFINTGISILYKKPTQKETSLFTFLLPFSGEVWIYVMGAYMAVSLILFVIGRLSPYEWSNPHPCRQNDQVEENCFSLLNSMWFTIGSLMQQGSDVAPTAPSTRTIASSWFFFNLIMISSYTANLASFLTVQNIVSPFDTAEDLSKQEKIKYGCIPGGSTSKFFSNSTIATYQKMWKFMKKYENDVFPRNSGEAKKQVLKGNYAFFTEAAWIEYIIERECELTQVGGLLDSKAYGIAVKKNNTKLSEWLSGGILKLQEDGLLHMLKERWWKQKRGGGKCAVVTSGSVTELGLGNVGGVFVVMMLGLTLAGIVTTLEFLWFSRKLEKSKDEPLLKMLLKELKFAVSCGDSEKPAPNLRKRKSSSRD